MSLTAKDVAEITRLLEESNFDELHLEIDGITLSLKRTSVAGASITADHAPAPTPPSAPPPALSGAGTVAPVITDAGAPTPTSTGRRSR